MSDQITDNIRSSADEMTAHLFDDTRANKPDPFVLFQGWLSQAEQSEPNDANAMTLSTQDAVGMPDSRVVLLNGISEQGFVFYTNTASVKGQELAEHPVACLLFYWKSVRRQVRIRGRVEPVSREQADAYFATRPRGSQIGAHASQQSAILVNRQQMMDKIDELTQKFEGHSVPRPEHWSGYRIVPAEIEFWQNGKFRLHDRVTFKRETDHADWEAQRKYP